MTMKRLILMRHAKSAWDTDAADDHSRPLSRRGRKDAPRVGAHLIRIDWTPDHVLSSDSVRTRQTWAGLSRHLSGPTPRFTRVLYHAGLSGILPMLFEVPASAETVLMLGHNPGWSDAVSDLTGRDVELKTGCAALMTSAAASWSDAALSEWTLHDIVRPKTLR